jgi:outer membrane protein assembly factor BamB
VIFGPVGPDGNPNNTIDAAIVGIDRLLQLGSILSSPAVANGVVYVGSADGSVYALD